MFNNVLWVYCEPYFADPTLALLESLEHLIDVCEENLSFNINLLLVNILQFKRPTP